MIRQPRRKSTAKQKWLLAALILVGLALFYIPLIRLAHPNALDERLRLEAWLIEHRLRGNPVVLAQLYPYRWDSVIVFNPYEYATFEMSQQVFAHYYGFESPVTQAMLDDGGNQFMIFRRNGRTIRVFTNDGKAGYLITRDEPVLREKAIFTYYRNPMTNRPAFGLTDFD